MWAQLIKMRVKPDKHEQLREAFNEIHKHEHGSDALVRTTVFRDEKDPSQYYVVPVFVSQEKARAREAIPERQAALARIQGKMGECLEGGMEFTDLEVVLEEGQ